LNLYIIVRVKEKFVAWGSMEEVRCLESTWKIFILFMEGTLHWFENGAKQLLNLSSCVVESAFEAKQGDSRYRYDVMTLLSPFTSHSHSFLTLSFFSLTWPNLFLSPLSPFYSPFLASNYNKLTLDFLLHNEF